MRTPKLIKLAAALGIALLAACDGDGGTGICPAEVVPALRVTVVDDETGADLSLTARGWWIHEEYADDLIGSVTGGPLHAFGPPGRYAVIVEHEGYQSWGRDNIRVTAGACGPRTLDITARLEPSPLD